MEIYVNQDELIELQKVYLPVVFKSNDGEGMSVVMRDGGFEIQYMGTWYSAKNGVLSEMKKPRISDEEAQVKEAPK